MALLADAVSQELRWPLMRHAQEDTLAGGILGDAHPLSSHLALTRQAILDSETNTSLYFKRVSSLQPFLFISFYPPMAQTSRLHHC